MKDLLCKHVDTVIVLGGILASVLWMNSNISDLKKDMAVVKAVLILNKIMPPEAALVALDD